MLIFMLIYLYYANAQKKYTNPYANAQLAMCKLLDRMSFV